MAMRHVGMQRLVSKWLVMKESGNRILWCHLELLDKLLAGVKLLEEVPDDEKDWNPGSNGQVLHLVHPSLFCVSYGITWEQLTDNTFSVMEPPMTNNASNLLSIDFAWLHLILASPTTVSLCFRPAHTSISIPITMLLFTPSSTRS